MYVNAIFTIKSDIINTSGIEIHETLGFLCDRYIIISGLRVESPVI